MDDSHTNQEATVLDQESSKPIGSPAEAITARLLRAYHSAPPSSQRRLELCLIALNSRRTAIDVVSLKVLNDVLELGQDAVTSMGLENGDFVELSMSIADLLVTRFFETTGDLGLLDSAICLGESALQGCIPDHPSRSFWCSSVAYWLSTRGEHTDNGDDFARSIALEEEALNLLPPSHPDRAMILGNLAVSIKQQVLQTGDVSMLDRVIGLEREALSLRPPGDDDRGTSCLCLAQSLKERYKHTADEAFLDEAISLAREALRLHPPSHDRHGPAMSCLAQALLERINRTYQDTLAIEAIELGRDAVAWCSKTDPNRDRYVLNLAAILTARYDRVRDLKDLDEAISLELEVRQRHPPTSGYRISCLNLASSYKKRYDHTGDPDMLVEALDCNLEALDCSQEEHDRWRISINLSDLYLCHGTDLWDLDKAVARLHESMDSCCVSNGAEILPSVAKRLMRIDILDLPSAQQAELLKLYTRIAHMVPLVAGFALDGHSQMRAINWCQPLASDAFLSAIKNESPHLGLELLETVRGIIWSQALHLHNPQFDNIPSRLAEEFASLVRQLASDLDERLLSGREPGRKHDSRTLRDVRHEQNHRLQSIIGEVRQMGFDRFMRGEPYEVLVKSANLHPVVILISCRRTCHAIVLRPPDGSLSHVHLGDIDLASLRVMLANSTRGTPDAARTRRGIKFSEANVPPHTALARLWKRIIKPVIQHLNIPKRTGNERPRIHWCPTGDFTFIPLHAAGIYEGSDAECCADYVVSSYTPTVAALRRARKDVPSISRQDISLLLVAESAAPGLDPLLSVDEEVRRIGHTSLQHSVTTTTLHTPATSEQVIRKIKDANIVHLACHGIQHRSNALKSGFCLHDGDLTVARLMKLTLGRPFLAFLSACETAKGDVRQPDQTVHLAAAMLFAGFKSVVATMWSMDDIDGPSVAVDFYERILSKDHIEPDDIPYALDAAVQNLRKQGAAPYRWATFIHLGA